MEQSDFMWLIACCHMKKYIFFLQQMAVVALLWGLPTCHRVHLVVNNAKTSVMWMGTALTIGT